VACRIMEGLPLANALTLGHGAVASITSSIPAKLRISTFHQSGRMACGPHPTWTFLIPKGVFGPSRRAILER
jgi:hypothetical protein